MPKPLSELVLSPRHLAMLQQILQQWVPQAEVWAYGSRVNGDGHSGSDLDLALHHCDMTQLLPLQEALQNSLLPMLVDLHLWERLPESFKQNILNSYIIIQQPLNDENPVQKSAKI